MNKRVAPSVELEAAIERLLAEALADAERLGELGRLGARLAIQLAVEEEVDAFLGPTRYERTPEARGWRNGNRPRQVQTAEGELEIQVPQIRGAAEKFVSSVIPNGRTALRTRPLEALIIGIRCRCPRGCAVAFPADEAVAEWVTAGRYRLRGPSASRREAERSLARLRCRQWADDR